MKTVKKVKGSSSKGAKNALLSALENQVAFTGNGALSNATTKDKVLDFFGKAGAARNRPDAEVLTMFGDAYAEDKNLAVKALFYLGDVRGGQGERRLFRLCFRWLAENDRKAATYLLSFIPEFTRWDNVLESLENTILEDKALEMLEKQLNEDCQSELPTLAGKWAPSEQASSKDTKRLAEKLRKFMKLSPKDYRKMLSSLRSRIGIVERLMCSGDWKEVNFEHVPSRAATLYKSAFSRHTPELYKKFLERVNAGKAKINAATLYPYDITRNVRNSYGTDLATLDAQWKALPNYLGEKPYNGLCVVDVSGSMDSGSYYSGNGATNVAPIDVAVSLAIYIAERNVGAFNGHFITFSRNAKLVSIGQGNIKDKVTRVLGGREVANTDLQTVFNLVLDKAVKNSIPESEMPSTLFLISDMQFDQACSSNDKTNLQVIREKYKKAGYKMPKIVFWNVNSYSDVPVKEDDRGVALVSGCSPSILKTVLTSKIVTPYDLMLETLNSERYEKIHA